MVDEQQIKQSLTDLANQNIPDTVDLWPQIEREILKPEDTSNWKPPKWIRYGRTVAAIMIISFISVASYALYQSNFVNTVDSGLQQVDRNLLNLQETQDGVTIILEWVYADAHRIIVNYSGVYDRDEVSVTQLGMNSLTTTDGTIIPPVGGGGGGGGEDNDGQQRNAVFMGNATFDPEVIAGSPNTLDLRLEINLHLQDPNTAQNYSTGGMMVSGEPTTFTFDFTTPFTPALHYQPETSVTANETTLTLQEIAFTPSMSKATLCHDMAEDGLNWQFKTQIELNGESVPGFIRPIDDQCVQLSYAVFWNQETTDWTLTIDALQSTPIYTESNAQIASEIMQGYGYNVEIIEIPGFEDQLLTMSIIPADNAADTGFGEAVQAAIDAISPKIDGPWRFTGTLP